MPTRTVPLATLLKLVSRRGPAGVLGLVFVLLSLFVLTPALLITSRALTQPYERYDFAAILHHGTTAVARIDRIASLPNVTVNGAHPSVISYTYSSASSTLADQFQTLELPRLNSLKAGDAISIKTLSKQSIIPSLKPFSFPFHFFFILPGIFLLIGIPFFLIGFLPALREYKLYRHGIAGKARVVGISTNVISTSRHRPQHAFVVSYEYAGLTQPKLQGESLTDDLLLVQEKKFGDQVDIFVSATDETTSYLVPRLAAL